MVVSHMSGTSACAELCRYMGMFLLRMFDFMYHQTFNIQAGRDTDTHGCIYTTATCVRKDGEH